MNGYKNFANDIRLVFEEELKDSVFRLKHESWFKDEFCHAVILESNYQYLRFEVDAAYLIIVIIDKLSLEFILIDELIVFLYPNTNIKKEKSEYFYHLYAEEYIKAGKTNKEIASILVEHLCLGDLTAYKKLIYNYLSEIVFDNQYSWTERIKASGKMLYKINVNGI